MKFLAGVLIGAAIVILYLPIQSKILFWPLWLATYPLFLGLAGFLAGFIGGKSIIRGLMAGFLAGIVGVTLLAVKDLIFDSSSKLALGMFLGGLLDAACIVAIPTAITGVMGAATATIRRRSQQG